MHATHTVHAMPDSRVAAGRLQDGDRYDSLPVLSFFSTALATAIVLRDTRFMGELLAGLDYFSTFQLGALRASPRIRADDSLVVV